MTIVDAGMRKPLEIEVVIPVEDMADLGEVGRGAAEWTGGVASRRRTSIWPWMYPQILDLILEHRSTIVFCNARRQAERLAAKLNELAEDRGIGVDGRRPVARTW